MKFLRQLAFQKDDLSTETESVVTTSGAAWSEISVRLLIRNRSVVTPGHVEIAWSPNHRRPCRNSE